MQPIMSLFEPKAKGGLEYSTYKLNNDIKELNASIIKKAEDSYGNFKDENGLITWSATLT